MHVRALLVQVRIQHLLDVEERDDLPPILLLPEEMLSINSTIYSDLCKDHKAKSFNICMQLLSAKQTWQQNDP